MLHILILARLYLFWLLMIYAIIGIIPTMIFYKILKAKYPSIYESLGSPSLMCHKALKNGNSVYKYIRKKQYRGLPDKSFVRLCDFLRISGRIVLIGFVVLVILTNIIWFY